MMYLDNAATTELCGRFSCAALNAVSESREAAERVVSKVRRLREKSTGFLGAVRA